MPHASQAFYRPLGNKTLGDFSPGPEALLRMGTGQITRHVTAFGTGMMFMSDSSVSDRMGIFCSLRFPQVFCESHFHIVWTSSSSSSSSPAWPSPAWPSMATFRWCISRILLELHSRLLWPSGWTGGHPGPPSYTKCCRIDNMRYMSSMQKLLRSASRISMNIQQLFSRSWLLDSIRHDWFPSPLRSTVLSSVLRGRRPSLPGMSLMGLGDRAGRSGHFHGNQYQVVTNRRPSFQKNGGLH